PKLAAELLDSCGIDIELSLTGAPTPDWRRPGILYVATPGDDASAYLSEQSNIEEMTPAQAALLLQLPEEVEPRARCWWLPQEGQVENRLLIQALGAAAREVGVLLRGDAEVRNVVVENNRVTQLETSQGEVRCERVLLCAGAWSTLL